MVRRKPKVLQLWGRANSLNVQKVLWCCAELRLTYERFDVGGPFGGNQDSQYLKLNPTGLVPTISDDGFILWESNAIVRYLSAKYGSEGLYPLELQERADAERWMDWQLGTLWAAMRPAYVGLLRAPKEDRDEAAIQKSLDRTAEAWTLFEAQLKHNEFVVGPSFTMADIPLGATVYRWMSMDIQRPPTPNIDAWYSRLKERPAFRENVMLPLS